MKLSIKKIIFDKDNQLEGQKMISVILGQMSRVFANGLEDRSTIPCRVIPKTQKNGTWCRLA